MISKETLQVLEFDKILSVISRFAHSDSTREYVLNILPFSNREDIDERFGQVQEIRRLAQEQTPLKLSYFQDISHVVESVKPEDAVLEPSELLIFLPVFGIISAISSQTRDRFDLPLLRELAGNLTGFPEILDTIERSIDNERNILDGASPELFQLRNQIRKLEGKIRKRLGEIVRDKGVIPFLQDDFITKRSGRWVIPVRMDSKGQLPGVVHDVSRSGETAFVEPLEIIGLANELENLVAEEKTEEIRILRGICQSIRKKATEIESQYRIIVYLDLLNSIARFADFLRMEIPQISDSPTIELFSARHPLLMLLQKESGIEDVVPLNLCLGGNNTVMVITGPNAGGKTVAIKTVGLLQSMALSGMPVTAESSSTFPFVNEILVDIGDEQSIESSLSTFSAHVSNISEILKRTDSKTLVIMDELGTGTDPIQGAAIACAVLKDLKDKGSLILATTHLIDIVAFIQKADGMVNASMEFDQETLAPLYSLKIGEPGQSHALDIARKYGLPKRIIDFAKAMVGHMKVEFHELIAELKRKSAHYEEALDKLKMQIREIEKKESFLKEKLIEIDEKKRETLEKAYREAQDIVTGIKRHMYALLEEAKRKKKRDTIKKLEKRQQQIDEKLKEFRKEHPLSMDEIKIGDVVFIRSLGYDATVMKTDRRHKRLRLMAGSIDVEVPISDIGPKKGKSPGSKLISEKNEETEKTIPLSLNLVGLRVDEALSKLEPFLNHASLAGFSKVNIVHGIGRGILLKAVHDHLNRHPLVEQFRSGTESEGGKGVTVVTIK